MTLLYDVYINIETDYKITCHADTYMYFITHWGEYQMAATLQITFSNSFSWKKLFIFYIQICVTIMCYQGPNSHYASISGSAPSYDLKERGQVLSHIYVTQPQCDKPKIIYHDDFIKWEHFLRYWPFVSGIHRPHKGQWRGALLFPLICAWTNSWANNGDAGDLRRHRVRYDVTLMV